MRVFDKIWLYDENDKEYQAQVREINERAVTGSKTKFKTRIYCHIVKPIFKGVKEIEIIDEAVKYPGWTWAYHQVPPVRQNAIVICRPDGHHVELSCRVLGLSKGMGGCHPDDFVFEGIKVMKNLHPGNERAANWKGHRFTASTECITKIIDEGTGPRLLNRDYLSDEEERALFHEQFHGDEDND
jgi:hypothetical protein